MEDIKLIFKTVLRKLWKWIKLFFRCMWNIVYFILRFILFAISTILAGIAYTSIVWVPLLAVFLLFIWSNIPVDRGPYYIFNSGWEQRVYLQSQWNCEVKQVENKPQYHVNCSNLNDNSTRNFFTDYYEKGPHYTR